MTEHDESRMIERLERYAVAVLSPDQAQMSRMRDSVVLAYLRGPAVAAAPVRGPRPWARRWSLAMALVLILATTGVVGAQSGPGQPFYGLRLAIASFTLPANGAAREHGLARQLDDRLNEAGAAVRHGDGPAAQAALQAYLQTLAELERGHIDQSVLAALQHHLDVLQALISSAPSEATDGLQEAIDEAGHASGVVPTTAPPTTSQPTPPVHESAAPSRRP